MDEKVVIERAINLKRVGRYDEAISLYHSVIDAIPQCDTAYKGLAKVEIGSGRYKDAIRSTLMKIDLGIFFTRQLPRHDFLMLCHGALQNLDTPLFDPEIRFGKTVIAKGATYDRSVSNPRASSVALLAWAETDLYFYLGHCLVRLFPKAFAHYAIPSEEMKNFENALLGHPSGTDARDTQYAPIFYVSGFWLAVANIESPITSIDPPPLKRRYNRQLDFMGLDGVV